MPLSVVGDAGREHVRRLQEVVMHKAIWGLSIGAAVVGYLLMRPWMNRWGTRPADRKLVFPGDEVVGAPNYEAMMGVVVNAPPEAIWPWLIQLGRGRGGLYSYDWLDRVFGFLDAPSAKAILPGIQALRPGDKIPIGKDPKRFYTVRTVVPNRALVVSLEDERMGWKWAWGFHLVPEGGHTRLFSRNRSYVPPRLATVLMWAFIELPAFIMTRRMLLNLRDRAEGLAQTTQALTTPVPAHR
jgi:hypothetical protein